MLPNYCYPHFVPANANEEDFLEAKIYLEKNGIQFKLKNSPAYKWQLKILNSTWKEFSISQDVAQIQELKLKKDNLLTQIKMIDNEITKLDKRIESKLK